MLRGLSGFLWGAVVSILALGALSVADRPVALPEAEVADGAPATGQEMEPAGPGDATETRSAPEKEAPPADMPVIEQAAPAGRGGETIAEAPPEPEAEQPAAQTPEADESEAGRGEPTVVVVEETPREEPAVEADDADAETGVEADGTAGAETAEAEEPAAAVREAAEGETRSADTEEDASRSASTQEARPAPARRPEISVPPAVSTETPAMAPPGEEVDSPLTDADTDPAARPETGETDLALASPGEGQEQGAIEVTGDSPVEAQEQAPAPAAPVAEEDLSISTEPAQPLAPEVPPEEESAFPAETASEAPGDTPAEAPEEALAETPTEALPEETPDAMESGAPAPAQTEATEGPRAMTDPGTTPEADVTPEMEAEGRALEDTAEPAPEATEQATEETRVKPSGTLGDQADGVTTGRLPRIGDAQEPAEDATDTADPAGDTPPIRAYAEPVEVEAGKPRMSIILIDDGGLSIGIEALEAFPYPLTFAVDATAPDAAERIGSYRARGFEVVAMVDLPKGATPTDAEVTLQEVLRRGPETVAVMETPQNGLSQSRALSDQVTRILADRGYGLVLFPKGLNTAQSLAEKAGVPAATIFRDFDAEGETPTVIRRFLDQAAFRAGQEENVIMVGRLRPDTISALLLWGLQDRANSVALVPVSQVLQPES
ncbi:divergent polysaccharide deacetylase family protein [Aquicoccus sp. SCR17]|nr:divergent polysaccharide deacetylase family protein [Carideicomes alvinocaridis]